MAEKQLEAAQKALRRTDYDSFSDEDEEFGSETSTSNSFLPSSATTSSTSSSIRQRGRPIQHHPLLEAATNNSFDPYGPSQSSNLAIRTEHSNPPNARFPPNKSLFDDHASQDETRATSSLIPGAAGYLEMEEEPPREDPTPLEIDNEPIKTSSGLLLTHRRSPTSKKQPPRPLDSNPHSAFRNAQKDYFEVETGRFGWNFSSSPRGGRHSMPMVQARRLLSYVKIWMVISLVLLMAATGVLFHSFGHASTAVDNASMQANSDSAQRSDSAGNGNMMVEVPEQIILVPMENISELSEQRRQQEAPSLQLGGFYNKHSKEEHHGARRVLIELRDEFESWAQQHGKKYHSDHEKDHRFNVWSQNHHRTVEKNRRHGPCKMTKQQVFGSNHLQDLSPEEFKSKFLTGYKGPRTDELEKPGIRKLSRHSAPVLNPKVHKVNMHESVKQRVLQQQQPIMGSSGPSCKWYDISCFLRWVWQSAGVQFGSIIGTMEPKFDASAFPNAVDWRDSGAVTSVRSQGDCGACWGITAVETVESAHYISTGNLYTLSEAEIIICDDTCEMCNGGWPQNAFEWVMEYGGLPLYNNFQYDGNTLLAMSQGLEGQSDTWTSDTVKDYRGQVCPAGGDEGSGSGDSEEYYDSGKENGNYGDYSSQGRYGNIKGYGYATDRCICYSDGSGCDCDSQNEDTAVGNIASYGPAVVCLEASLWQDYSGGIITSDLGCGSAFLDMNHCVQAVGYAFTTSSDDNYDEDEQDGSNSGSDSNDGSQDDSNREGYWIIRNQWGYNWGMSGYAYVAMGENTCGVLNDMTQAYL